MYIDMSANREVRELRCDDALAQLMRSGQCVFFTLTTPQQSSYSDIRDMWRGFRNSFFRSFRRKNQDVCYIMNYEAHPGYLQKLVSAGSGEILLRSDGHSHGWHIHGVISTVVPCYHFLALAHEHGFGRCDIRRVNTLGVSHYLTKHALKAYRGLSRRERQQYGRMRLVNCSRGLPSLSDYQYCSNLGTSAKMMCREFFSEYSDDERRQIPISAYRRYYNRALLLAMYGYDHLWQYPLLLSQMRRPSN